MNIKKNLHQVLRTGICVAAFTVATMGRSAPASDDTWQLTTAPYLWLSGIDGDVSAGNLSVDFEVPFEDIADATEYGFQSNITLRKEAYGFYVNPAVLKLEDTRTVGGSTFTLTDTLWIVEFGALVRLGNWDDLARPLTLDLVAGGRYWNNEAELERTAPTSARGSTTTELIDPIVGLQSTFYLTEKFSLMARADVGGFEAFDDDSSKLSWQAMLLLGYDINERFTVYGGYRALALDVESDDGPLGNQRELDVTFSGALLGLAVHW